MATGISLLSQELIDKIIDYFFKTFDDDVSLTGRATVQLRICALISRAFRERSQKHLFTVVKICMDEDGRNATGTYNRLNKVFSMNPQLVSHIRVVKLILRGNDDPWHLCFADPNFVACITHILQSGIRDQRSPNLHLYLGSVTYPTPMTNRTPRNLAFETLFIPMVASRLTVLEIWDLSNLPIALFDTCHNLNTLCVRNIRLAPFEDSKRVPIKDRPSIRELRFAYSEDFICRSGLHFDNLSKVVFQGDMGFSDGGDMMTIRHILSGVDLNLSSLESLDFFTRGT